MTDPKKKPHKSDHRSLADDERERDTLVEIVVPKEGAASPEPAPSPHVQGADPRTGAEQRRARSEQQPPPEEGERPSQY